MRGDEPTEGFDGIDYDNDKHGKPISVFWAAMLAIVSFTSDYLFYVREIIWWRWKLRNSYEESEYPTN